MTSETPPQISGSRGGAAGSVVCPGSGRMFPNKTAPSLSSSSSVAIQAHRDNATGTMKQQIHREDTEGSAPERPPPLGLNRLKASSFLLARRGTLFSPKSTPIDLSLSLSNGLDLDSEVRTVVEKNPRGVRGRRRNG